MVFYVNFFFWFRYCVLESLCKKKKEKLEKHELHWDNMNFVKGISINKKFLDFLFELPSNM